MGIIPTTWCSDRIRHDGRMVRRGYLLFSFAEAEVGGVVDAVTDHCNNIQVVLTDLEEVDTRDTHLEFKEASFEVSGRVRVPLQLPEATRFDARRVGGD